MQLCAITDRLHTTARAEGEIALRQELRERVAGWIEGGVDFIQLREKDLDAAALCSLARQIFAGLDRRRSKLLVNLPALEEWLGELVPLVDGVHLASRIQPGSTGSMGPGSFEPGLPRPGDVERVRNAFRAAGREAIVSLSCHSVEDVHAARRGGADLVLFAPVFEKTAPAAAEKPARRRGTGRDETEAPTILPGQGLGALRRACEAAEGMRVFALGGVTAANTPACMAAGADGIAGIRLFATGGWRRLRGATDI